VSGFRQVAARVREAASGRPAADVDFPSDLPAAPASARLRSPSRHRIELDDTADAIVDPKSDRPTSRRAFHTASAFAFPSWPNPPFRARSAERGYNLLILLGGPESTEAVCKRQIGRFGVRCPLQVRTMKTIRIKVKPNARSSGLEKLSDGTWLARVASPPVDGKANEELVRLIAERFSVRKAQVSIKSGASGRLKLVQIADA